ncbi:MAG: hypothetical protein ACFCBU_10215 [Cyanophyceae cyanobacterium]
MTPNQTRHPEAPPIPDSVAWQPIPIYRQPSPPPAASPTPAPKDAPKIAIAYALLLSLGAATLGLTAYRAGVGAGESGSAAKVAILESQAAATGEKIENFCKTAGH